MKEFIHAAIVATLGVAVVLSMIWITASRRTSHTAPTPAFTCVQTISADDAHRIATDLHVYSSEGDSVRFQFECREKFTVIRLERAR